MRYFSLFTGVGGFEIGIENASITRTKQQGTQGGGRNKDKEKICHDNSSLAPSVSGSHPSNLCVGFSEIDKYCNQVLAYRFPNVKNYGDITKINWSEVPDFDLLVGGSPCQDFSIAGKRAGISGERSGLVWEFIRCLEEKKPQYFIWENVKGVMSSRKGFDFGSIITAFSEVGYSLWWQVLNAKDFGVPQNRERIFVCGFRGESPREVFFERETNQELDYIGAIMSEQNNKWLEDGKELSRNFPQGQRVYSAEGIGANIASQAGGLGAKTGLYVVSPTIRAEHHNTADVHFIPERQRIRRLTPTECERLMSWEDDWTKYGINEKGEKVEMSDTQRYKMCGNGVVSKVVEEVVKNIIL